MEVICDMANGTLADCRYFFENIHDWIKTDFMTNKVANSYVKNDVYCVLLPTNSSKQ